MLISPGPGFFKEFFSAQIITGQAFFTKFFFNYILSCNTCMISSREPQSFIAAHPVVTGQYILQGFIESVPHMENTGNIRRRYNNGIRRFFTFCICFKKTSFFPESIHFIFGSFGVINRR